MPELLAELARRLVDEPDAVRVEQVEGDDGSLVLRLHVAEDDVGKVIGRQGRHRARAAHGRPRRRAERRPARCSSRSSVDACASRRSTTCTGTCRALEAVLGEIPDDATIVVGGDVVAGGPQPSETLERLRALGDRVALAPRQRRPRARRRASTGLHRRAARRDARALTDEQIEFLARTAARRRRSAACSSAMRRRGTTSTSSPSARRRSVSRRSSRASTPTSSSCGHTHMQFERTIAGKRVVNSGSVGMPYEDEPGAYWTLLGRGRASTTPLEDDVSDRRRAIGPRGHSPRGGRLALFETPDVAGV